MTAKGPRSPLAGLWEADPELLAENCRFSVGLGVGGLPATGRELLPGIF